MHNERDMTDHIQQELDRDLSAAIAHARVMDAMLDSIFPTLAAPANVCMSCGRPLAKRGLCESCRDAKDEDDIQFARSAGLY